MRYFKEYFIYLKFILTPCFDSFEAYIHRRLMLSDFFSIFYVISFHLQYQAFKFIQHFI
jgi:hypothetical protein